MFEQLSKRARAAWRKWMADTAGVVALVVVFAIPAFIAAAGVAVDLAQGYNIKTRLAGALDKAALAAGSSSGTTDQITTRVNNFIAANYPAQALGAPYDVTVTLNQGIVDVIANAKVKTVFMGIFGQDYLTVTAETIVKKEVAGLELVLVMDNTGSMADPAGGGVSKIDAAKTAAKSLLDILFGANSNVPILFVGVVPFSQDANIGTQHASWTVSDTYDWGTDNNGTTYGWPGAVEARDSTGRDITDDPPSVQLFPKYYSACGLTSGNSWRQTIGSEYATNGDFGVSTGWTQGPGWTIGSGTLSRGATSNIAVNGDFSVGTGWSMDYGWSVSGGVLTNAPSDINPNSYFGNTNYWTVPSSWLINTTNGYLVNNPTTTGTTGTVSMPSASLLAPIIAGHTYLTTYDVGNRTAGSVKVRIGGGSYGTSHSANGTYSDSITAGSSGGTYDITGVSGFKGTIDNLYIIDQTTSARETPSVPLIQGDQYQVVFTVNNVNSGSISANVGGTLGTARSTAGTYTQTITAGSGTTIGFSTTNAFNGSVDNITVTDVTSPSKTTRTSSSNLSTSTTYLVTYTIVSQSSGSVQSVVGNKTGTANSSPGTYHDTIKPSSTSGNIIGIQTTDGFIGSVDNFSVKPLTNCGNGPSYWYSSPLDNVNAGPDVYGAQPMLGMTNVKADIEAAIDTMYPAGGTMIPTGMVWGWRMLSPRWRGLWGGVMDTNNLPLDYDYPTMNKVIILMTDGDNSFGNGDYSAYGLLSDGRLGTTSSSTANTNLNTKTTTICTSLKSHDVLIYTIALGTQINTTSANMLKGCATSPAYYFASPTTADLQQAFTAIANQLNSLHIVH